MKTWLRFASLTGAIVVTAPTSAEILSFQARLDGLQETPPVATNAAGFGTFTLDTDTRLFSWNITFANLGSAQTNAHFHGAAPVCEPAGVTIPLPMGSPLVGSQVISPAQMAQVIDGLWYVNIHTMNFPNGEIRGQVFPTPLEDPLPDVPTGDLHVQLLEVANGLIAPNWGTSTAEAPNHLIVTDQDGTVWAIDLTVNDVANNKSVLLDASSLLVPLGAFGPGSFDERGLLGVAFPRQPLAITRMYTYTSEPVDGPADFSTLGMGQNANHQAVVREWIFTDVNTPIQPGSSRELLRIDEPQFNHNGGCLNFGHDDMLYISLGDGGGADDQDGQNFAGGQIIGHGCCGNGQDTENPLGALLRIDPFGSNSANGEYGVPADNPFAVAPDKNVDELFVWGLRNPFRFSFDRENGDLLIADVGQNDIEEVNHIGFPFPTAEGAQAILAGGNFGWNYKEGSFFFIRNGSQAGYVTDRALAVPAGLIDPVAQYDHDEGVAVVGGFVYRGSKIPALFGKYVFGDFSFNSNPPALFYLDDNGDIQRFNLLNPAAADVSLLGFGEDANGEIYVLANTTGTPFPDGMGNPTGVVLRIAPKTGDLNANGVVNGSDLATLLANWGPQKMMNASDLDMDGDVDGADLASLLANWG